METKRKKLVLYLFFYHLFDFKKVRAALVKSIAVYMSLRGHLDWIPRRHSMFSAAIPDLELPRSEANNRWSINYAFLLTYFA